MKRILFLLHQPPPIHGSSIVGKTIKDSKQLNSAFECKYINLLSSRKLDQTGKFEFVKIFRFVVIVFSLLKEMINFRPVLCYMAVSLSGYAFYKDVLIIMILKLFRTKRIYHLHHQAVLENKSKFLYGYLYKYIFRDSKIILLSSNLYNDIKDFVSFSDVFICPNGIQDEYDLNKIDKCNKIDSNVNILFLSNLHESKGIYYLLDALNILRNKGILFTCTLVGGEGDINKEQINFRIESLSLIDFVYYCGKKTGDDKIEILSRSDIFVHPTYNDCFPLVLLEAMQFSLPIISTYEGGIPDIVDDKITGFLVPTKDSIALANKLEILIKDKTLRLKFGEIGRLKYEEKFTLERFENNINDILSKVIT